MAGQHSPPKGIITLGKEEVKDVLTAQGKVKSLQARLDNSKSWGYTSVMQMYHSENVTLDKRQQEISTALIAQMMHDFMQLKVRFRAFFPHEIAQLKRGLDAALPKGEVYGSTKYELFYRISSILYREGDLTMGRLSSAISVPLSTATRMVDWLVDNGYATRLPDTADRRIVRVALTESGRRLHEVVETYTVQRVQQILSGLTVEEQRSLSDLLHKMASAVKDSGL